MQLTAAGYWCGGGAAWVIRRAATPPPQLMRIPVWPQAGDPVRLGYKVTFAGPVAGPDTHRIRNFAEDLNRALDERSLGGVPNMDTARDQVLVEVNAARDLGPALQAIRMQLARSGFDDNVSVERLK